MPNLAMRRKVDNGEAIDISDSKRTPDGDYVLTNFIEDVDYCDLKNEEWIWSIGRSVKDGTTIASTSNKYYENADFECIWLR